MNTDIIISTTVRVRVFEIKEGTTTDIFNSGKTFDFGHDNEYYVLDLLDIPDNLQENKNKLWLKFRYFSYPYDLATYHFMNWVGYIDLDDMSLRNGSSFIKFPTDKNFPVRQYTTNTITNQFGSALYITGGEIYSKKLNDFTAINSFYKYNFTSREWVDMTYTTVGKLKPLYGHNSVVIDNRYLVILGGERQIYNSTFNFDGRSRPEYEHNTLYNLTVFDTFTNRWDNINVSADIFDTSIAELKFELFVATVYKDKIIVLGGTSRETKSNRYNFNNYIGVLDFKSKIWSWSPILNEDGSKYATVSNGGDIQILNDQLIILSSVFRGSDHTSINIFDMLSQRMKSTLRLSNSLNDTNSIKERNEVQNQSKLLPNYAIALIAICCTALLGVFIYLIYRKIKSKPSSKNSKGVSNGPIREVWANPDIDNTINIITFDKTNCSSTL